MLTPDRIKSASEKNILTEAFLTESWKSRLEADFRASYILNLQSFLQSCLESKKKIFPSPENYFKALNSTEFEKVKVVILGQDPYHKEGQAHGLSFSVPRGVKIPPSLVNIFKELKSDLGLLTPENGCLESWTKQGVLLLNSVLTVEEGKPASHQGKGWEAFTDRIISILNKEKENLVFILWGSFAQKKAISVDRTKHLVLESVHPSPLSSHRGFFGSKPFSKANLYLKSKGLIEVDWSLRD